MSVPAGYKATEVGVIPEDWEVRSLGDFGIFKGGSGFPLRYQGKSAGDFPFYKVSDMNNKGNSIFMSVANHWICEKERKAMSAWIVPERSIIFAKIGAAIFLERKRMLSRECIIDNNVMAFMLAHDATDVKFLYYQFLTIELGKLVSATALPSLNGRDIAALKFGCPDVTEQAAIAEALSDVDAAIGCQEAVIAKKRALKTATMQALLSGTRRLPGFSGKWVRHSFDQLFQFLRNGSNSRAALSTNGAIGYIHYGDIHSHPRPHMDCGKGALPRIARDLVSRLPRVQDGDLLIADASEDYEGTGKSVEATNIGDDEVVAGLHTLLLRPVEKMALGFAGYLYFIPEVKLQYVAAAQGVSVYGLSRSAVKSVEVALPKYDEQAAISSCLMDIEIDLSHQLDKLKKLRDIKAGMMQQLLTGKIRLV